MLDRKFKIHTCLVMLTLLAWFLLFIEYKQRRNEMLKKSNDYDFNNAEKFNGISTKYKDNELNVLPVAGQPGELGKPVHIRTERNVFPFVNYYYLGNIWNLKTGNCLDTMGKKVGENLGLTNCNLDNRAQNFVYTKSLQIIADNNNCLDASMEDGTIRLVDCHGKDDSRTWIYDFQVKTIMHINTGQCLEDPDSTDMKVPLVQPCKFASKGQKWIMNN